MGFDVLRLHYNIAVIRSHGDVSRSKRLKCSSTFDFLNLLNFDSHCNFHVTVYLFVCLIFFSWRAATSLLEELGTWVRLSPQLLQVVCYQFMRMFLVKLINIQLKT